MSSRPSYFAAVLSHPQRERLLLECPALQLVCYQHVVGILLAGAVPEDPFSRVTGREPDAVSELLAVKSPEELLGRVFPAGEAEGSAPFWGEIRKTLEAAWAPALPAMPEKDASARYLATVCGTLRFCSPTGDSGTPLSNASLQNAVSNSKRFLRSVTTCALSGSTTALGAQHSALSSIIQFARLAPPADSTGEVTSEGLNFCMLSLQQQWWVLVCGALDRVLALTQRLKSTADDAGAAEGEATDSGADSGGGGISLARLWQLLAVLAVLDTSAYMYDFPDREEDLAGYHLLGRLSEVGLVYLVKTVDGRRCFVLSPHFGHAMEWQATTPLCSSFMLGATETEPLAPAANYRREDTDTIITETNFRLYAYTRNEDLLRILDQFAEREEDVGHILVCFRLTRHSFVSALRKGITATQILKFLSLRAHPSMLRKYGEDSHAVLSANSNTPSSPAPSDAAGGSSRTARSAVLQATSAMSTSELAIPQSVCDQLLMWESECNRVVFLRNVVLLRNMSPEQQSVVTKCLDDLGKHDAIVHSERGYLVVREEVYDLFLANMVPEVGKAAATA